MALNEFNDPVVGDAEQRDAEAKARAEAPEAEAAPTVMEHIHSGLAALGPYLSGNDAGVLERFFGVEGDHGVDGPVEVVDTVEVEAEELPTGELARGERGCELARRPRRDRLVGHVTLRPGPGVGTSSSGMVGGGPHAIAALENADASAVVNSNSTISAAENSASRAVRRSSVIPPGSLIGAVSLVLKVV